MVMTCMFTCCLVLTASAAAGNAPPVRLKTENGSRRVHKSLQKSSIYEPVTVASEQFKGVGPQMLKEDI